MLNDYEERISTMGCTNTHQYSNSHRNGAWYYQLHDCYHVTSNARTNKRLARKGWPLFFYNGILTPNQREPLREVGRSWGVNWVGM